MVSVIIPFHNEKDSLPVLVDRLKIALDSLKQKYEIIMVDDGSTDNYKLQTTNYKLIKHKKRLGKGKALETGFKASSGDMIIFMDADLQDDPKDIGKFLEKIDDGFDLVNGWRKKRADSLSKTIPSSIFNFFLLKLFLKSKFHDINCGFKAIRREVLEQIPLYGDNYRFLPLIADKNGFRTTEIAVAHNPRKYGISKYGFFRMIYGFFDTLTTYFIAQFSEKPLHFFGPIGGVPFLIGLAITLDLIFERIFYNILLYRRPAFQIGILLIIVGMQIIMTGVIAELIVYLNQKNKKPNE